MTGRPEDIQPVMIGIANEVGRLRSTVVDDGHGRAVPATIAHVQLEVLERIVSWFTSDPVCACPCHRERPPEGFTHQQPCCDVVTEVQVVEEQGELHGRQLAEWSTLPLYQETVRCPKCGSDEAATFFCSRNTRVAVTVFGGRPFSCEWTAPGQRDHLHRVCSRCGFPWTERPLDDGEGGR